MVATRLDQHHRVPGGRPRHCHRQLGHVSTVLWREGVGCGGRVSDTLANIAQSAPGVRHTSFSASWDQEADEKESPEDWHLDHDRAWPRSSVHVCCLTCHSSLHNLQEEVVSQVQRHFSDLVSVPQYIGSVPTQEVSVAPTLQVPQVTTTRP